MALDCQPVRFVSFDTCITFPMLTPPDDKPNIDSDISFSTNTLFPVPGGYERIVLNWPGMYTKWRRLTVTATCKPSPVFAHYVVLNYSRFSHVRPVSVGELRLVRLSTPIKLNICFFISLPRLASRLFTPLVAVE